MKVKVRNYKGTVLEIDSAVNVLRDGSRNAIRVIQYRIVILCDDGARVELSDVSPNEIEVLA
jgi:hypothetical protein|nr:MAG TPA: hypothetical protein [Caudoviricetes sp.]